MTSKRIEASNSRVEGGTWLGERDGKIFRTTCSSCRSDISPCPMECSILRLKDGVPCCTGEVVSNRAPCFPCRTMRSLLADICIRYSLWMSKVSAA